MTRSALTLILILFASCAPDIDEPKLFTNEGPTIGASDTDTVPFVITAIDVGQGDATLIETPAHAAILIDGGLPGAGREVILPLLKERGIDDIDLIIASHFDEDHIGGIAEVIKGEDGILGTADDLMPNEGVIDRGGEVPVKSASAAEYIDATAGIRRKIAPGETIDLDNNIQLTALIANGILSNGKTISISDDDENAHSIGLFISYGDFRYFTYGDLPGGGGAPPYKTQDMETPLVPLVGDIDVLHISHHGSNTSTNEAFLDGVTPEVAIISVGNGNDYWHPHRSVIDRLIKKGVTIYQTENGFAFDEMINVNNGNIVITNDGINYDIE